MKPPPPRTQPPPPCISPPMASYRSARKEELEQLRQKGLAKIFNKHFTSVADKITLEREAAELALNEIIKRKAELAANPKSFKEGGLTLTQLDKLYMELKKRKSDVQRKERETQELYKRYCSQYEDNEHVMSDVANWKNSTSLPVVQEGGVGNVDMIRQADLAMAKANDEGYRHDVIENDDSNVQKISTNYTENNTCPTPNSNANIMGIAAADNPNWDTSPAALSMSPGELSKQFPTPNKNDIVPDVIAPSTKITPTKYNGINPSKNVNSSVLDATAASTPTPDTPSINGNVSVMDRSLYFAHHGSSDDDDSAVSGLTDIDCATVAEAEWKLTEFLRTETDNIKKMLINQPALEEEDGDDDDNYSIYTYNRSLVSGESDRVGRAAREAEAMVKRMAEATAWMNDPTLLDSESDSDGESSDEEEDQLEWVAFWSGDHDRVYYHNRVTNQTCWTEPQGVEIDSSKVEGMKKKLKQKQQGSNGAKGGSASDGSTAISSIRSPTKSVRTDSNSLSPPRSDEKVAVKDFTKNNSNISKNPSADAISVSKYTNDHMIKTFRPDTVGVSRARSSSQSVDDSYTGTHSITSTTKSSKVMQYRRKRAMVARRKRRLVVASVLCIIFGLALFFKKNELMQIFSKGGNTSETGIVADADARAAEEQQKEAETLKKLQLAKKLASMEAERKRIQEQKRLESEAVEEAERKLAEEKMQKAELEAKQKAEAEALQVKLELEMKQQEEDRAHSMQLQAQEMHRPWACNVPFTYIMSRKCWRVAKSNPIYDCEGITDFMME